MGKKILVVDDEPDFLRMIKMRLEAKGYDVVTATNGKEALENFKSEKPDAVLLDIMMPGIDGLQVLRKIRRHDKDLPVFIITAFSSEERIKLATKMNASGFIIKTGDLQEEIERVFTASRMADRFRATRTRRK